MLDFRTFGFSRLTVGVFEPMVGDLSLLVLGLTDQCLHDEWSSGPLKIGRGGCEGSWVGIALVSREDSIV